MEFTAVRLSPYPLMLLSFVSSEAHSEVWISGEELEVSRVEIIFIPSFSSPLPNYKTSPSGLFFTAMASCPVDISTSKK